MLQRLTAWWNEPEQELLNLEFRRAVRFFWSWTGLVLIAVQLALIFLLPQLYGKLYTSFGATGTWSMHVAMVLPLRGLFVHFAPNAIWIYLLFGKSYSRFRQEQREQLLMLPMTSRMIWPALLATPLVWLCIVSALECAYVCYSCAVGYPGSTPEQVRLRYLASFSGIALDLAIGVCLTFLVTFVIVPKCSFARFLWIFLSVCFLQYLMKRFIEIFFFLNRRATVPPAMYPEFYMRQDFIVSLVMTLFWLVIARYYLVRLREAESWRRMEGVLRQREAA